MGSRTVPLEQSAMVLRIIPVWVQELDAEFPVKSLKEVITPEDHNLKYVCSFSSAPKTIIFSDIIVLPDKLGVLIHLLFYLEDKKLTSYRPSVLAWRPSGTRGSCSRCRRGSGPNKTRRFSSANVEKCSCWNKLDKCKISNIFCQYMCRRCLRK